MKLVVRYLAKNFLRTMFTILALTLCTTVVAVFMSLLHASDQVNPAWKQIMVANKRSVASPLSPRHLEAIRALPNVQGASRYNWFDCKYKDIVVDCGAVDGAAYFDAEPTITVTATAKQAWLADAQGVLVDEALAKEMGWKVGDVIALDASFLATSDGSQWSFRVAAFYTPGISATKKRQLYAHWRYMNEKVPAGLRDRVQLIHVWPRSGIQPAALATEIDRHFASADPATLSSDPQQFRSSMRGMFVNLIRIVSGVGVAIALVGLLIVGNTIVIAMRERVREYAVLQAIGFTRAAVLGYASLEGALIGGTGSTLGVVAGFTISAALIAPKLVEKDILAEFHTVPSLAIGIIVAFSLICVLISILSVAVLMRRRLVDLLRFVG